MVRRGRHRAQPRRRAADLRRPAARAARRRLRRLLGRVQAARRVAARQVRHRRRGGGRARDGQLADACRGGRNRGAARGAAARAAAADPLQLHRRPHPSGLSLCRAVSPMPHRSARPNNHRVYTNTSYPPSCHLRARTQRSEVRAVKCVRTHIERVSRSSLRYFSSYFRFSRLRPSHTQIQPRLGRFSVRSRRRAFVNIPGAGRQAQRALSRAVCDTRAARQGAGATRCPAVEGRTGVRHKVYPERTAGVVVVVCVLVVVVSLRPSQPVAASSSGTSIEG